MRAGDEAAFVECVGRYHALLVAVARRYVADAAAAEDIAQEVWVAVLRGLERFEGRSSVKTWLLVICANRAKTAGVRARRMVPVDPGGSSSAVDPARFDAGGAWIEPPTPFTDSIDDAASDAELRAAVRDGLAELGEPMRTVVTLRDVEGLPTAMVASVLELSEGNVRVLLHRGRARLRSAIETKMTGGGS